MSVAAGGSPPVGYKTAFANLQGAIQSPNYLTYQLQTSYDVAGCASFCNSVTGCTAFNIYFERDPQYAGTGCSLTGTDVDLSATNVHCALFGALPNGELYDATYATNTGQYEVDGTFQVAIAGKSGYFCSLFPKLDIWNRIQSLPKQCAYLFYADCFLLSHFQLRRHLFKQSARSAKYRSQL